MKALKNWIIRKFELKGSWGWAKKQMMKGHVVKCKHWSGALKYRISPEIIMDEFGRNPRKSTLLQANFVRDINSSRFNSGWETSNHHLSYEDFTDYEIVQ